MDTQYQVNLNAEIKRLERELNSALAREQALTKRCASEAVELRKAAHPNPKPHPTTHYLPLPLSLSLLIPLLVPRPLPPTPFP